MPLNSLVIGTHNRKKGAELADLLAPHGFSVVTLDDVPNSIEVEETGDTFAANAALKATEQARHLNRWILADDSGLAVDALNGAPGVYSARYATWPGLSETGKSESALTGAQKCSDDANNARLLRELEGVPLEKRTAHYVADVCVADPTGTIRAESVGICRGRIRFEPVGTNGFGYDPLFEVIEYHRTFGELGPHVKQALSHRSRALRAIIPKLLELRSS